jgi:hypothetical protein
MARKSAGVFVVASLAAFALFLPAALGANGGGKGKGGGASPSSSTSGCTQKAPGVSIDNTYGWGQWGSWGLPGQQLTYAINILNYDVRCASSTFVVSVSAPSGFSVWLPTSSITLRSGSSAYVHAQVTSPSVIGDGDDPISVTVARAGSSTTPVSAASLYKVYSSDSAAPTLYWPNPQDGVTVTGKSYNVAVSSSDDHGVQKIELYLDNVYMSTTTCQDIAFECQLFYKLSLSGLRGKHTATFKSYDWRGNVGVLTSTFTAA